MAKKNKIKNVQRISILSDKFVPKQLALVNYAPVACRWVLRSDYGGLGGQQADNACLDELDPVIAKIAEHFIPRVPCMCAPQQQQQQSSSQNIHGPIDRHLPAPVHVVPPDFQFALINNDKTKINIPTRYTEVDLDETTSIKEYASCFRGAIRAEHETIMRLYEKLSLFKWRIKKLDDQPNQACIEVVGLSDVSPSLRIHDIVLLRPIQSLSWFVQNPYNMQMQPQEYTIEIETRILHIIRGKGNHPDRVIIAWDLDLEQRDALKDHAWLRDYNVRFIPSTATINRCLTALDWLENLSAFQQEGVKEILFPVAAPVVKPLTAEQRRVQVPRLPTTTDNSSRMDLSDIDKPLNELQSSFVRMVRARTLDPSFDLTRPPMILTGPAGTGKTKTLIYAIADVLGLLQNNGQESSEQQRKNSNRVLICCPSHAASDVLTRRLAGLLKRSEIFRMYDATRPSSTVPGSILPFTCQLPGTDRFTLPPPNVWVGLKVVICTCMDSHLLFRAQITNHSIRAKRQCFRSFLLSDSNPLGISFGEIKPDGNPFFTHLFIDEAAQATEPEILCPISCVVDPHFGGRKVEIALVGDPRQLSPRIFANDVADSLGRSFMERLLRRPVTCMGGGEESLLGPEPQTDNLLNNTESLSDLIRYYARVDGQEQLTIFLTENYRSHPSFLMMPSSFFYFDRLKSAKTLDFRDQSKINWCDLLRKVEAHASPVQVSIENPDTDGGSSTVDKFGQIHRQLSWPIHFRGVKGKDVLLTTENFSGTAAWANCAEAEMVVDIISTLINNGVKQDRIGAMAPFRGQVVHIRKLLREKYFHDVNVGTIENYQAVEQDVIVLSLTRACTDFVDNDMSKRIGIFGMPKQANVAMTRAENLFIIVGNPDVMWRDRIWRQWLRFCLRNGLWFGQGLKQWLQIESISMKDMNVVGTLDMTQNMSIDDTHNSLVVSTLEKIHRLHQA